MTFVHLIYKDLFHSIRIVLVSLCDQALAHLLKGVLGILISTLHLHSRNDTLLTVTTDGNSVLTFCLLFLAVEYHLIDPILLLLVFHLQMVLIVRIYL